MGWAHRARNTAQPGNSFNHLTFCFVTNGTLPMCSQLEEPSVRSWHGLKWSNQSKNKQIGSRGSWKHRMISRSRLLLHRFMGGTSQLPRGNAIHIVSHTPLCLATCSNSARVAGIWPAFDFYTGTCLVQQLVGCLPQTAHFKPPVPLSTPLHYSLGRRKTKSREQRLIVASRHDKLAEWFEWRGENLLLLPKAFQSWNTRGIHHGELGRMIRDLYTTMGKLRP